MTQSIALAQVAAFAEALQELVSLRQVVLFGSYARNEQRQWSDMDVAIIAEDFTGFGFQDVGLIGSLLSERPFLAIEPHTFSPAQFTDDNPFVREIKRTGIVIGEWEPAAPPRS